MSCAKTVCLTPQCGTESCAKDGVSYSIVWDRILRERRCILLDSVGPNPARKTVCLTRQCGTESCAKTVCLTRQCGTESCAKDGVSHSIVWDRILRERRCILLDSVGQNPARLFGGPSLAPSSRLCLFFFSTCFRVGTFRARFFLPRPRRRRVVGDEWIRVVLYGIVWFCIGYGGDVHTFCIPSYLAGHRAQGFVRKLGTASVRV